MSERSVSASTRSNQMPGVLVAAVTAFVSGISVFVNSYGVHSFASPIAYTTVKNIVAAVLLLVAVGVARVRHAPGSLTSFVSVNTAVNEVQHDRPTQRSLVRTWGRWIAFAYVGVIGGGLAFALFFRGLAVASPTSAAFWRDTMVLWVALGAVTILGEHMRWWNVAAIGLLVAGEIVVSGGIGPLDGSSGEMLVLAATVLWAIEVIVVKLLLRDVSPATVSIIRMTVGSGALVFYLLISGGVHGLVSLSGEQIDWALWTGALLALYVGTWMTALARARALDVTSVLVGSAVVTWLLQLIAGSATPVASSLGLILIMAGVVLVAWTALRRSTGRSRSGLT